MSSRFRRVMGSAALGWMAYRMLAPDLGPRFPGPQERPLRITGRTVVVGQRELFIREAGPEDAPSVVLVHGWVFDSVASWHKLMPMLAERFRVIAIDFRNHGRSERIRGAHSIEDVADELAGVMDAIGLESATFVGYSMGGLAAQCLARRHPGKVERLVLAGTGAFPIPVRRALARVLFALGRVLWTLTPPAVARPTYHYLLSVGAVERRHARWLWGALLDRDPVLYFESGKAIWRFDSRGWLSTVRVPALVIIPTEDQLVPPPAQYEMASLLPEATVLELVGARHEAPLTHTEDIAKAITAFIE